MKTSIRTRRVSSPAYYLARPASLWLAAFTPRPAESRPEAAALAKSSLVLSGAGGAGELGMVCGSKMDSSRYV